MISKYIWNLTGSVADAVTRNLRNPIIIKVKATDTKSSETKDFTFVIDSVEKLEFFVRKLSKMLDDDEAKIRLDIGGGAGLEVNKRDLEGLPKGVGRLFDYIKATTRR